MVADATYDQHLDVIIDAGLEQELRISPACGNRRDVQLVGPVECDRGDPGAGILLVENDLLRWRDVDIGHLRVSFPREMVSCTAVPVPSR